MLDSPGVSSNCTYAPHMYNLSLSDLAQLRLRKCTISSSQHRGTWSRVCSSLPSALDNSDHRGKKGICYLPSFVGKWFVNLQPTEMRRPRRNGSISQIPPRSSCLCNYLGIKKYFKKAQCLCRCVQGNADMQTALQADEIGCFPQSLPDPGR